MSKLRQRYQNKWKLLGDFSILLIPILSAALPNMPVSEAARYWCGLSLNISLVGVKFWTSSKNVQQNETGAAV